VPQVTENGITFFRTSDLDSFRTISTTGVDEDTTVNISFTGTDVALSFDRTKTKDPDVDFNTETSVFQYFEDDYLENNPATIDDIIQSYVGLFYRDTGDDGQNTQDIPFQVGTRFSRSDVKFDSTSVRFSRRTT